MAILSLHILYLLDGTMIKFWLYLFMMLQYDESLAIYGEEVSILMSYLFLDRLENIIIFNEMPI